MGTEKLYYASMPMGRMVRGKYRVKLRVGTRGKIDIAKRRMLQIAGAKSKLVMEGVARRGCVTGNACRDNCVREPKLH